MIFLYNLEDALKKIKLIYTAKVEGGKIIFLLLNNWEEINRLILNNFDIYSNKGYIYKSTKFPSKYI